MNGFEFLASVIDSLAWPTLVGSVIYVLRDSVEKLLDRVSHFKYKDLEAEFRDTLEKIKSSDEEIVEPEAIEYSRQDSITLYQLADISPRAAIMESWIKIEKAVQQYLESAGLDKKYSYQGLRRLPTSYKEPIEHILTPYQELRLLRNKAAHASDFELNSESARAYAQIANYIVRELEGANKA